MGLWIADENNGLLCLTGSGRRNLCRAPLCLCASGNTVVCAQRNTARVFAIDTAQELADYPLPPEVRRMCALPGALYCLSAEADSVSLLCPLTGRLRLCVQAGCYPRDLCLSPCRRLLAAAGGASGTLYLYRSEDLSLSRRVMLPGVVYAACFCGAGLAALCAVEENEVSSRLYRISTRGVISEALCLPGLPGALLPLPDGGMLVGVLGTLLRLRADGRIAQRFSAALPGRLRGGADAALCADPLSGQVLRVPFSGARPAVIYEGDTPADMLIT